MAGGNALLALAGPVGWAIGGVGLVAGGAIFSSKNKKIAEEAESKTRKIKKETNEVKKMDEKIILLKDEQLKLNDSILGIYNQAINWKRNYKYYNSEQKAMLQTLVNNTHALSKKINEKVD